MSKKTSFKKIRADDLYFFEGDRQQTLIVAVVNGEDQEVYYPFSVEDVADHFKLPIIETAREQFLGVNFSKIGELARISRPNIYWIEGSPDQTTVVSRLERMGDIALTFPAQLVAAHFGISTLTAGSEVFGINYDNLDSIYPAKLENGKARLVEPEVSFADKRFLHVRGAKFCRSGPPKSALVFNGGTILYTCFPVETIEQLKCARPLPPPRTIAQLRAQLANH